MIGLHRSSDRLRYVRRVVRRRAREWLHRRGILRADAYVMEYPKSGGSWLMRMTEDLFAVIRPTESATVRRDHWRHARGLRPAIYVVRDGRDVVVSLYFYHQRELTFGGSRAALVDDYLRDVLGDPYDLGRVAANLPPFIQSLRERPFGGLLRRSGNRRLMPWPDHIADWYGRPDVLDVRYEDLLTDPAGQMARVARHLNLSARAPQLDALAARHSFSATSGRMPGEEDRTAHQRKGIAGDWKNHFTREAARAFQGFAGQTLVDLGYEPDASWVQRVPEEPPDEC